MDCAGRTLIEHDGPHDVTFCRALGCEHGPRSRLHGLDRLRGLAVLLMVVDHALVAVGGHGGTWGFLVRVTATRASLPLFCLVAGALVGPAARWGRLATIGLAGCAATVLGAPLGIGQPDVLLLLAVALAVAPWCRPGATGGVGAGAAVLVLAVLQPVTWPIPWTGYQPGTVVALVVVGQLLGRSVLDGWGWWLPWWVARAGRWPLTFYIGHLAVLGGLTWAF